MKKILILLLTSLLLCGCTKEMTKDDIDYSNLTMDVVTKFPEEFVQDKKYSNFVEITGTLSKTDYSEPDEEFIEYCKENNIDDYVDIYANTYYYYLDHCDIPLESSNDMDLIVGHKYRFKISVQNLLDKYYYHLISCEEI